MNAATFARPFKALARKMERRATAPDQIAVPWWVNLFTDVGRPVVAVVVMVMCAPGEHHLGRLAGWDTRLAWGMAFVLAAYAGIAAAVASKRPKGAAGKGSAVLGAWLALAAAMTAQALSHAIVTGHVDVVPKPPLLLVLAVSSAPPLVFGHLLHLAATPVPKPLQGQADSADSRGSAEPTAVIIERIIPASRMPVPHLVPHDGLEKAYKPRELTPALPGTELEAVGGGEVPAEPTAVDFVAARHGVKPDQIRTVRNLLGTDPKLSGKAAGTALGKSDRYGRRVLAAAKELEAVSLS